MTGLGNMISDFLTPSLSQDFGDTKYMRLVMKYMAC